MLIVVLLLFPVTPALLATNGPMVEHADAIYVFPGQVPDRALCAAELYKQGRAPRVVFSGANVRPELIAVELPLTDAELNARIATSHGVPEQSTSVLSEGTSTWEDAGVLASWMKSEGVRSVIAVTSPSHSRRASWSLWFALGPGDQVSMFPCGEVEGPLWWTEERTLVRVTQEALKLGFYAVRHFLPAAVGLATPTEGPRARA